jgi:hypothetical protein
VRVARFIPGVLGAGLISVGLGLIYLPLAAITAGAFLLWIDWRLK